MTRHVAPIETRPAGLQALAKLPVFLDVTDRRVVVTGGGAAAAWKAELLAAAGAKVDVYASDAATELQALAAATPAITLIARPWRSADLVGAAVAVGET